MRTEFQIQKLAGYTDSKPSWSRVQAHRCYTKQEAQEFMNKLKESQPEATYRVRKVIRK